MECPSPSNCCLSSRSQRLSIIRSSLQARCNLKKDRGCFSFLREPYTSLQPLRRSGLTRRVGEEISTRGGGTVKCPEWVMRDERGKGKRDERDDWERTRIRGIALSKEDRGKKE